MPDYTQDHSIPYPLPTDPVRGSTSDYLLTDLRDLATGADAAISTAMGTRAPLSHTHAQSDVTGLPDALDAAASTADWGGVSGRPSAFPPAEHTHPMSEVDGLAARLADLEFSSGPRDVSSLLRNGWVAGSITLARDRGSSVSLNFENLDASGSTSSSFMGLPPGFRPRWNPGGRVFRSVVGSGYPPVLYQIDIDGSGNIRIFVPSGANVTISGTLNFSTPDSAPSTVPGDPA